MLFLTYLYPILYLRDSEKQTFPVSSIQVFLFQPTTYPRHLLQLGTSPTRGQSALVTAGWPRSPTDGARVSPPLRSAERRAPPVVTCGESVPSVGRPGMQVCSARPGMLRRLWARLSCTGSTKPVQTERDEMGRFGTVPAAAESR